MIYRNTNYDDSDEHGPDIAPICDVMVVKVAIFSLLAAGASVGVFRAAGVACSSASASTITPVAQVRVDRYGEIQIAGRRISRTDLGRAIRERIGTERDPVVILETDDLLPSGDSKGIRGIIQDAGCRPVEH